MSSISRQRSDFQKQRDLARSAAGPRPGFIFGGVSAASFAVSELMHFLLVPDIGRRWERWMAECISATVVGLLTVLLMKALNRHRAITLLRLQVISEMNQHVRSALSEISLTVESIENQECIRKISENVDHIEWALREILLRPIPVADDGRRERQHLQQTRTLGRGTGQRGPVPK